MMDERSRERGAMQPDAGSGKSLGSADSAYALLIREGPLAYRVLELERLLPFFGIGGVTIQMTRLGSRPGLSKRCGSRLGNWKLSPSPRI
jgi:hypothetical protein